MTNPTNFSHPTSPHTSLRDSLLLFLFAAIMLAFGLNRGLIFDEYKTRMVADLDWYDLVRERLGAGHLPTYFAMVKAWLLPVPYSNWAMRIPGALFAALGVIPFYFIGRQIAGRNAGLWVGIIYALNQEVVWAGQAARPYGPLLFFEGLIVVAALQWWATLRPRWVIVAGLASLGGILMMPLSALVTVAILIAAAVTSRGSWRRFWPLATAFVVSMAIGFMPAALVASSQEKLKVDRGWDVPRFGNITDALATMVYGDYSLWARGIMEYIAQVLFVLILVFAFRKWRALAKKRGDAVADPVAGAAALPWRTWCLTWIFVPLVILVLVSATTGRGMVNHSRYQAPALGGVIVLFGVALTRFRAATANRWLRDGLSFAIITPLVITAVAWQRDPGEGVAPVAREMIAQSDDEIPAQVAGHVRWLRLDLPEDKVPARELFIERRPLKINEILVAEAEARGQDVTVIDYDKSSKDVGEVTAAVEQWAQGAPFWLFVYIQEKDGLDKLAKYPPAGYKLKTTVRKGYARAYYFK